MLSSSGFECFFLVDVREVANLNYLSKVCKLGTCSQVVIPAYRNDWVER